MKITKGVWDLGIQQCTTEHDTAFGFLVPFVANPTTLAQPVRAATLDSTIPCAYLIYH